MTAEETWALRYAEMEAAHTLWQYWLNELSGSPYRGIGDYYYYCHGVAQTYYAVDHYEQALTWYAKAEHRYQPGMVIDYAQVDSKLNAAITDCVLAADALALDDAKTGIEAYHALLSVLSYDAEQLATTTLTNMGIL